MRIYVSWILVQLPLSETTVSLLALSVLLSDSLFLSRSVSVGSRRVRGIQRTSAVMQENVKGYAIPDLHATEEL